MSRSKDNTFAKAGASEHFFYREVPGELVRECYWQYIFAGILYGIWEECEICMRAFMCGIRLGTPKKCEVCMRAVMPGASATRELPAEPLIWEALTDKRATCSQIRWLCKASEHLRLSYPFDRVLYERAPEFCDAKKSEKYPKSDRASSDDRRVDYFAEVLAPYPLPRLWYLRLAPFCFNGKRAIRPATAQKRVQDLHRDLDRKGLHGPNCPCWECRVKYRDWVLSELTVSAQ